MTTQDQPQIYLFTPPAVDLEVFPDQLARILDDHTIACVRLDLASQDADTVARTADVLREVTHARDVALVVSDHLQMVARLGLDGVHFSDAARAVRDARKELGADAIIGAHCATSRHDGMAAGEAGADYISFGPVSASELGDGKFAELDLFQWWSEVIEVPVVAEGQLNEAAIRALTPCTDFFGIGAEIWSADAPEERLAQLLAAMG